MMDNNEVRLTGRLGKAFEYSHEAYGESFYTTVLLVQRTSGTYDEVPLLISEDFIYDGLKDSYVDVIGQFRSFNNHDGEKKLLLHVFVQDIRKSNEQYDYNYIFLDGYICKKPTYRKTPFGREISDVILAVNRLNGKSDYIPCICWGKNASYMSELSVGDNVQFTGKIQSREYTKNGENKVAYEVSVSNINHVLK